MLYGNPIFFRAFSSANSVQATVAQLSLVQSLSGRRDDIGLFQGLPQRYHDAMIPTVWGRKQEVMYMG